MSFILGLNCALNPFDCHKVWKEAERIKEKVDTGQPVSDQEAQWIKDAAEMAKKHDERGEYWVDKVEGVGEGVGKGFQKMLLKVVLPVALGYFIVQKVIK